MDTKLVFADAAGFETPMLAVFAVDVATGKELFLVMEYVPGETLGRLWHLTRVQDRLLSPAIASAIIVDVLTDNKNRAVSEVRHAFSKNGGNMGAEGAVAWMTLNRPAPRRVWRRRYPGRSTEPTRDRGLAPPHRKVRPGD